MGVRDQAVAAAINKKDKPAFLRLAMKIRKEVDFSIKHGLPYDGKLIDEFWKQCRRKHNDHTAVYQIGNKKIELENATVTNDLPTNPGLDQCIRLIMASSSALWRYMEAGNGTGIPTVSDATSVSAYSPRIDMTLFGTREPVGMSIRFLAVFGEGHPAIAIKECGVFSALTGATMLNHNIFSENPLNRILNQQAGIIGSIVEFCPKAT
jgi:hypothetical protein